ncbi:glycoside hydrolase family 130 protein [Bacteroidales bacterium OttesenSCG-928-I14]|nr:glycoside hydrolase family 130 protein [Bacteroidales bacterium OttesenSCG-928-I14]
MNLRIKNTLLFSIIISGIVLSSCQKTTEDKNNNSLPEWAFGGFVRPEGVNPVIKPDTSSVFFCPMNQADVKWEESDAFNPAAVVKDDKICVLYRAEDNSATGIGKRVSRVALAESQDGVSMTKHSIPVLFPAEDNNKEYEWPGGCEDPRVAVTEDGLYVMHYTSWDRRTARLCVATSRDLLNWEKHGPVFAQAYEGRFKNTWSKAASILTKVENGKQVITKLDGKYFMYWGEYVIYGATSEDLVNWTPILDENDKLKVLISPREGYFDSNLTECGPPAILTDKGILLLYNGKNATNEKADPRFNKGTYSAGQVLADKNDPFKVLGRLDVPFFRPMDDFEKSGQYVDGTVFIEGLVFFKEKWYLYYGCADSKVGVAVYDPQKQVGGDMVPVLEETNDKDK